MESFDFRARHRYSIMSFTTFSFVPAMDMNVSKITLMPVPTGIRDNARKLFELTYKGISPVNITLSLLIILLNTLVIAYYRRKLNDLTPALFFSIAISDILTAVGSLLFAIGVLLWSADPAGQDETMWRFYLIYRTVGLGGYAASIFFNTLLSVTRSIVICNPFYQPKVLMMQVFSGAYLTFLVALGIFDVYFFVNGTSASSDKMHFISSLVFLYLVASSMSNSTFLGQGLAGYVYMGSFNKVDTSAVQYSLLTILYLLPVLVVLVSMVVQLVVVQRARARSSDTEHHLNNWSHINSTVFLLAVLFFFCNGALTADTIAVQALNVKTDQLLLSPTELRVFGMVQTMLPLLNSLLAPVVLVSRNPRMRQDIRMKVTGMFLRGTGNNEIIGGN